MSKATNDLQLDEEHRREARASLHRIERILESSKHLDREQREALIEAAKELGHALEPVFQQEAGHARSLAHFAEAIAHEASKPTPSRDVIDLGIQGLQAAVRPVEQLEPRLVDILGRIASALSSIGI